MSYVLGIFHTWYVTHGASSTKSVAQKSQLKLWTINPVVTNSAFEQVEEEEEEDQSQQQTDNWESKEGIKDGEKERNTFFALPVLPFLSMLEDQASEYMATGYIS